MAKLTKISKHEHDAFVKLVFPMTLEHPEIIRASEAIIGPISKAVKDEKNKVLDLISHSSALGYHAGLTVGKYSGRGKGFTKGLFIGAALASTALYILDNKEKIKKVVYKHMGIRSPHDGLIYPNKK